MDLINQVPYENMVKWRRHFHQNPELSFKEFATTDYIIEVLSQFPELKLERVAETGVVAVLEGASDGPTIALRADIDALPVMEETGAEYASDTDGIMHACGHDVHAATLLGTVETLVGMKDKLKGKVKFIFQAAEEAPPGGARILVEKGVLDGVQTIYGLHVAPMVPVGMIGTNYGPVSAASDTVTILIKGKGAHGSMPNLSIDPVMIGTSIIQNVNNIVSRNIDPFANVVISVGKFEAGQTHNVIPHTAEIKITVRTNKPETRELVKRRLALIVEHTCVMWDAEFEYNYTDGYSAVQNDKAATQEVFKAADKVLGPGKAITVPPMMGGEDFSAYTDTIPGAFFMLGGGTAAEGIKYGNHHPKFDIKEECMKYGAAMFTQIILDKIGE